MSKNNNIICSLIVFSFFFSSLYSHPGRTDSRGGHNCSAESKAKGLCCGYHYHREKQPSSLKTIPPSPEKKYNHHCESRSSQTNNFPSQKYQRSNWEHWIDKDGDCQDERAEILILFSEETVKFRSSKNCVVDSGKWFGVYTGKYYYKASDLDIDHIVPLKEAYRSGGKNWSKDQKRRFANDHENLLPVEKSVNREKKDCDPAQWLPSTSFVCEYIKKWQAIKDKYELTMDTQEKIALEKQQEKCNAKTRKHTDDL